MPQPRKSYAENRKEVYKFWLGFLEKTALVVVTVAILPHVIGQLDYTPSVFALLLSFILILAMIMAYLSRRLWYLHKDREVKND